MKLYEIDEIDMPARIIDTNNPILVGILAGRLEGRVLNGFRFSYVNPHINHNADTSLYLTKKYDDYLFQGTCNFYTSAMFDNTGSPKPETMRYNMTLVGYRLFAPGFADADSGYGIPSRCVLRSYMPNLVDFLDEYTENLDALVRRDILPPFKQRQDLK